MSGKSTPKQTSLIKGEEKTKTRVLLIHNGDGLSVGGISGGTMRSFEVVRRWCAYPNVVALAVTTPGGLSKLRAGGLSLSQTVLKASLWGTRERFRFYRFISYIISVLDFRRKEKSVPPVDVAFSSSDFFCDTAVAKHLKGKRPAVFWAACIHHLYTSPWKRPGNPMVNWVWYVLQRRSLSGIARYADLAFVYDTDEGDRVRDLLIRYGMEAPRIRPMRNGVDFKQFQERPTAEPEFDALFVGELRSNKGVFDFVPIWKRVCASVPGARLRVVGHSSPEMQAKLTSAISKAGLESNISFAGEFRGEPLIQAYRSARIFFMPSHEEGWGIAICEAMASGLPIVAYDLPAYRRHYRPVLHHVPCFDTVAFADEFVRLLRSPDLCAAAGKNGRQLAAEFDWDTIARQDWESVQMQYQCL